MTRDDIIKLADEADLWADQELQCIGEYHPDWHEVRDRRFAALVAAAEREACALVAQRFEPDEKTDYVTYASQAIRARGETK